VMKPFDKII